MADSLREEPQPIFQRLPALVGERIFSLHAHRCVPSVDTYGAYRRLLADAKAVLEQQLTEELVSRSLGLLPDATGPDSTRKTVALLTRNGEVLAALAYFLDTGGYGAQLLVAATSTQHRRCGHMRTLFRSCCAVLLAEEVSELCLAVSRANPQAASTWEALGFRSAAAWPSRMTSILTSSDLGTIFRLDLRAAQARERRAAAAVARPLRCGCAPDWPEAHVPFTSACGWPSAVPHTLLPAMHQPAVAIRRLEDGRLGLIAKEDLLPGAPLLAFGGQLVPETGAGGCRVALGDGLELSAEEAGNECRYCRVAAAAVQPLLANAHLQLRHHPLTGAPLVTLSLLWPVKSGEEIVLDSLVPLPRRPRDGQQRKRRLRYY